MDLNLDDLLVFEAKRGSRSGTDSSGMYFSFINSKKGYSRPNLFRMLKLVRLYPDVQIVSTLSRQLSWSHFIIMRYTTNQKVAF